MQIAICDDENRQTEAAELAKHADLMVVIGSPDSSNSRKLAEVAREHCKISPLS